MLKPEIATQVVGQTSAEDALHDEYVAGLKRSRQMAEFFGNTARVEEIDAELEACEARNE